MSEAGRCGSCKWWTLTTSEDIWDRPHLRGEDGEKLTTGGYYEPVPAPGAWGKCERAGQFGPKASDRFYVIDGSEYVADLNTRDDFGCVEWVGVADAASAAPREIRGEG